MSAPNLRPADLTGTAAATLSALEERIGSTLVAYEAESPYASLDAAQLDELKRAEGELGVRLVAYSRNAVG